MRDKLPIDNPAVAKEWDDEKNIGIRPEDFSGGSEKNVWWRCQNCKHSWKAKIYSRTEGRGCPKCGRKRVKPGINDLATLSPALADEWDDEKNFPLRPSDVTCGSNKYVWWRCKKHSHSWYAQINKRFSRNQGCCICNNQQVLAGFNDLATTHPHIAAEWNRSKNGSRLPDHYTKGADANVWWECGKCGYEWEALIYSRTSKKPTGCPCCARNTLVRGVNDLQTVNPTVAAEWDDTANGALRPDSVAANDNRKARWGCAMGHSWEATIASRNSGKKCPYCTNRLLLRGFNDLATRNPVLADEWDNEKNWPLTARDVIYGSHDYAWWECDKGHSWRAQISNRANGTNCPYCEHKVVSPGETDLATVRPDIADAWDYEKNYPLTPDQVAAWSNEHVWWKCKKCGQSYKTAIANRASADSCPYCAGKLPIVGVTDFATVHPELLDEYDYEKNGSLTPQSVVAGSHTLAWWYCRKHNHHWQASFDSRHRGRICEYCNGSTPIPGETDAATITPELRLEWHTVLNKGFDLQKLLPFSNLKFWWECGKCHKPWQSTIGARTAGSQCPRCNGRIPARSRLVM
jgi:DNA-directed RNA polymerase subunit RPC12/RpoP